MEPLVTVNGEMLNTMDKFAYLGSTLSKAIYIDDELAQGFGRLQKKVWERRHIRLPTRLNIYRAFMLTPLLYACETCTVESAALVGWPCNSNDKHVYLKTI